MTRNDEKFVCQTCGASHNKWSGKCDDCGAWNSLVEEAPLDGSPGGARLGKGRKITLTTLDGAATEPPRIPIGIDELDRGTGAGLVPGSALLIGGDPGIGKSTLVLQAVGALAKSGIVCAYISGEESVDQVRMRARRLGLADASVHLASETNLRDIIATLEAGINGAVSSKRNGTAPDVLVIDSIQTMYADNLESAPGSVAQVRACAQTLITFAKTRGTVLLLVGHVTKDGQIAGPRVLEHMVDTVLYFEGERGHRFRILRSVKNRFGATDEIGVFEMTDGGLNEVPNPSSLFLGDRQNSVSGAAVFAGMEGTRPLLVEIQALVAPSPLATPRRAVVGWDSGRLAMVLAVLDARCDISFAGKDVYLNVDVPVPPETIVFGEASLAGEVRQVGHADARLKEATKLGFKQAIVPAGLTAGEYGLRLTSVKQLKDLVPLFAADAQPGRVIAG
ncbi:MAG TPA: DNA repair protein RadA [Sneathiellales bacterium]|nr:DNA repair protein RadA [Sneathiellales bacterium]